MIGEYYNNQIIKKSTAVFGTLFNNIRIKRFDDEGNVTSTMRVPLSYAPKQKWYSRVFALNARSLEEDTQYAIRIPSMGFEISSMIFDTTRRVNRLNQIRQGSITTGSMIQGRVGAPYSIDYTLYVFANNTNDWTQILEQIVPFFQPNFNIPIKLIKNESTDESLVQDISVTLNSVSPDQNYYGDFRTRQTYVWNLSFTLKVDILGHMKAFSSGGTGGAEGNGGIIEDMMICFYTDADGNLHKDPGEQPVMIINLDESDLE
jgi:hypothetical protein